MSLVSLSYEGESLNGVRVPANLEGVFLDFVEEGFVADTEIFGGFTLVAQICLQGAANLFSFDETQGAMTRLGKRAGKIELVESF